MRTLKLLYKASESGIMQTTGFDVYYTKPELNCTNVDRDIMYTEQKKKVCSFLINNYGLYILLTESN